MFNEAYTASVGSTPDVQSGRGEIFGQAMLYLVELSAAAFTVAATAARPDDLVAEGAAAGLFWTHERNAVTIPAAQYKCC